MSEYVEARVRVLRADLDALREAERNAGLEPMSDDNEIGVSTLWGIQARTDAFRRMAEPTEEDS